MLWKDLPEESTPLDAANLNVQANAEAMYAAQVGQSVVDYFPPSETIESSPAASTAYTYNADGTVATATKDGQTDVYGYNADGTLHTISYWYGKTETFSYNVDGTVAGSTIT